MAGEHIRLEFLIISKIESQEHVKALAAMAHYQTDPTRRKGLGDVVRLERPWMDDSPCDRLLISLPYPFGPKLEWCDHIRFLWLMPITESEHKFILEHGVEAFEEKLEWSGPRASPSWWFGTLP